MLVHYENLVALLNPSRADPSLTASAVNTYQIEVETAALVRAVEDLLTLTRLLKETWLFGKLDTLAKDQGPGKEESIMGEDVQTVGRLLEGLVARRETHNDHGGAEDEKTDR